MKIRTKDLKARNSFVSISTALLAVLMMSNITSVNAGPVERKQAKQIHERLTGVPPTQADLTAMENLIIADGNGINAALYAMDPAQNSRARYFYDVTLKNWVTPWTNVEQTMFADLNDYTATVIGMIRNNDPFNEVLSASYIYTGDVGRINSELGISIPNYSNTNNDHYQQMEANNVDLSEYLVRTPQADLVMAGSTQGDSAGVITTRAAGEAFFSAGTNRRMLRFTLMNYMCRDLEDVKDITRVPDGIRQDVSRSPGGDSTIFLNSCIGCHSGMDPLTRAYAYYEWDESSEQVTYTNALEVTAKHHINRTNFEYGNVVRDHGWQNYWREGPNAALEWDWGPLATNGTGNGAKELGEEIANTHAFAQCQVEKVYKQVCLQDPIDVHATDLQNITASFGSGYNMRQVFAEVAALCMGN